MFDPDGRARKPRLGRPMLRSSSTFDRDSRVMAAREFQIGLPQKYRKTTHAK
jgi:hypothetical protein